MKLSTWDKQLATLQGISAGHPNYQGQHFCPTPRAEYCVVWCLVCGAWCGGIYMIQDMIAPLTGGPPVVTYSYTQYNMKQCNMKQYSVKQIITEKCIND